MADLNTVLTVGLAVYALITGIFLISENRRPQATLAWMLAFVFAPGVGVVIYFLFGRSRKAFSQQTKLLRQNLEPAAKPLLWPILSQQDAEIDRLETLSEGHKKLMRLVRRNSHSSLVHGSDVAIQQNASTFYANMLADIRAAKHSIHLQYYIWRSDHVTDEFKHALIAKAREGVKVRLLYDPIGSLFRFKRADRKALRAAGVQVAPTSRLYLLHTISYRNHRKITVVDGMIGYTGGMNMGREHVEGAGGMTTWRDTQVRFVGQAAAILQSVFATDWYNAVGENIFTADNFPEEAMKASEGDTPIQILTSGPDSEWAAIRQTYFSMIVSARKRVYLQSPYFILDATMAEALSSVALAGVDVRVMLSARASGDRLSHWAGQTYVADVARAGVRVFSYEKGYLHAKTISVDGEICSIGSANIDIRSFSINYELNAVIYSEELASQLERDFERDLDHCVEFDPDAYRKLNPFLRFRDSVARLLSPLL